MKVKIIKGGEVKDVSDSYAVRLIEQGKAVAIPKQAQSVKKANA